MSTSPSTTGQQAPSVRVTTAARIAPVVLSPIPQGPRSARATTAAPVPTEAASYAAGWAQGMAAAAAVERRMVAEAQAVAAAERERARVRTTAALVALDEAAEQMRQRTAPAVDATADLLVGAAVDLAEVVVGREVADVPGRGRDALARALAPAPEHAAVMVRLHPTDLATVTDLLGGPDDPTGASRDVELVADHSLAPGDAIAEYPGGSVDARVATALARMRSTLRGETRTASGEGDLR